MKKNSKLNIIEPWEHGTEKAIKTSIIDGYDGQFLFHLPDGLLIDGINHKYLIGELRDQKQIDLLSPEIRSGTYQLNMVYSSHLNEETFKNMSIKNFRSSFLLGEVILQA